MVERSFSIREGNGIDAHLLHRSTSFLEYNVPSYQRNCPEVLSHPIASSSPAKWLWEGGGEGASSSCTGSVNNSGLDFGKIEFLTPFLRACSQCSQNANLRSPQDVWKFSRPARAIGQF